MQKRKAENAEGCTGHDLKGMFEEATSALEMYTPAINQLNVFPVPDGDTGTNMLLTMRAALDETRRAQDSTAGAVSIALARGSLMGARGNSGVILSQIFRGMARALEGKSTLACDSFSAALAEASQSAYKGVSKPVEGTMLTVIREVSTAVAEAARDGHDLAGLFDVAAAAADDSVLRTPSLLPVLREAGVVDAGGRGLAVILRGASCYMHGQKPSASDLPVAVFAPRKIEWTGNSGSFGYCTEFMVDSKPVERDEMRARLEKMGDSVMVVGEGREIRAHLHTKDPGAALTYAASLGVLHQIKVENIDDQHRDFMAGLRPRVPTAGEISTVVVASGEGIARVFESLGASCIVSGGETMNPSVGELLQAIDSAPSDKVLVLPNDSNVMPAAAQACALSARKAIALPSKSAPQGIAAMLALNPALDLESNVKDMSRAISAARTGQVTTAIKTRRIGGVQVKKGQAIGFNEQELVAVGEDCNEALAGLLDKMAVSGRSLVTLYYGADTAQAEVDDAVKALRQRHDGIEIEVVFGGQPHYNYIISVE